MVRLGSFIHSMYILNLSNFYFPTNEDPTCENVSDVNLNL